MKPLSKRTETFTDSVIRRMTSVCLELVLISVCVFMPGRSFCSDRESSKRAMAAVPGVVKFLHSAEAEKSGYTMRSLLWRDEACENHKVTEWDAESVAGCDVYFSVGMPFEEELTGKAKALNPKLKVVNLDSECEHIKDNPYVWLSVGNAKRIEIAAKDFFGCRKFCMCGSPFVGKANELLRGKGYKVAITSPAFAYECATWEVGTIPVDPVKLIHEDGYIDKIATVLRRENVLAVFGTSSSFGWDKDLATKVGCEYARIDVFGGAVPEDITMALLKAGIRRDHEIREREEEEECKRLIQEDQAANPGNPAASA